MRARRAPSRPHARSTGRHRLEFSKMAGMNAVAVWPSERRVGIASLPEPELATPTDVLLRVLAVGVCGTDREIASFEYGTPPAGSDHLVLGHESLAEVVRVGA